jgi:hypothetical protein
VVHPDAATWRKIGVREGDRVALLRGPTGWETGMLPAGVCVVRRHTAAPADVVVAFQRSLASLHAEAAALAASITTAGLVWVAWPRRAAGHVSDLTDKSVRDTMLALGLVDVKVAMLDEDWSGLKFVWRGELRAGRRGVG